jgi:predicted transcriptional regulator of viral defense system
MVAQVAKRVPHATICLLSALQIHGMTTEVPHAVWIMIHTRARRPKIDTPALEVVEAQGPARAHGVETRRIEGVPVSVTTPAKTVADCFRYRRDVGLDVAIAALRDYLAGGTGGTTSRRERRIDALVAAARADRVYSVMRPSLEALA